VSKVSSILVTVGKEAIRVVRSLVFCVIGHRRVFGKRQEKVPRKETQNSYYLLHELPCELP
jgi:hypothetical protein